jgi:hypothetical protein
VGFIGWHHDSGKGLNSGKRSKKVHIAIMRVEESIEINKPLQEVFNYVSDVGS